MSYPTSSFGSSERGSRRKTKSSKLGLSFAAQPAALAIEVNRTLSAKAFSSMRFRKISRRLGPVSPALDPVRERKHYTLPADSELAPGAAEKLWPWPQPLG